MVVKASFISILTYLFRLKNIVPSSLTLWWRKKNRGRTRLKSLQVIIASNNCNMIDIKAIFVNYLYCDFERMQPVLYSAVWSIRKRRIIIHYLLKSHSMLVQQNYSITIGRDRDYAKSKEVPKVDHEIDLRFVQEQFKKLKKYIFLGTWPNVKEQKKKKLRNARLGSYAQNILGEMVDFLGSLT